MENKIYNVLIVEDEYINAKFVEQILINLGHEVIAIVSSSEEAIDVVKSDKIDLVFMDINIDGPIDGIKCAFLLNLRYEIPVIYMTAYGDTKTIDEASNTNLYGYLIKPFDRNDVEASLKVALKMISNSIIMPDIKKQSTCIKFENSYLYTFETKSLTIDNIHVELTNKESLLMHLFCLNINQDISYELLLESVWKDFTIANSTIRDTISRLRKKAPLLVFENISGIGYRLTNG